MFLTHDASSTKMPTTAGTRKVNTPVRSYSMAKATPKRESKKILA